MLDFLLKKFRGEKDEETIEAISYKSYRSFAYREIWRNFSMSAHLILSNRIKLKEIINKDYDNKLTNIEAHAFFRCLKIKNPQEFFIDFDLLKESFPYAKHDILQMRIDSSNFFSKVNNEMETLFTQFHREHTTNNLLIDFFILITKMTKFYHNYLNTKILELYLESERKIITNLIRKENSWKKSKKEKEAAQQDFGLNMKSVTKIEQKESLPLEYFEKVINIFQKYVPTKDHNKVQKHISRILESAYKNNKPAPIDTLLIWLKNNFNLFIQDTSEFEQLKKEAAHYGFDISKKFVEEIHEKVRNTLSGEKNENTSHIKKNDKNTNSVCEKNILSENITANEFIKFFQKQKFDFENEKKFKKQFDSLLYLSQFAKEKRNKCVKIFNENFPTPWEIRPNNYFVLKIDAGGEALRLVKRNNCIVDFLNHDEYMRKYKKLFNI